MIGELGPVSPINPHRNLLLMFASYLSPSQWKIGGENIC